MLLFVLFTLALSAPTGCKVAFRLDEVQDYWLTETQTAIIQTFVSKATPLTLSVISRSFGLDYAPNSQLVPFINNLLNSGATLEIAASTMDASSWSTSNLTVQVAALQNARTKLKSQLSGNKRPISSVTNPNNVFNQATLDAMRNTQYTLMSSAFSHNIATADGHAFYSACSETMTPINAVVHTPSSISTASSATGRVSNADILAAMEAACNTCGYSVLEIHFTGFSNNVTKQPEATAMSDLGLLVDTVKAWPSVSLRLLQDMTSATGTPISSVPVAIPKAPVPAPHAVPTKVPTPAPKAAPKVQAPTNVTTRTSGSTSTHPFVFLLAASFVLQVIFG